MTRTAANNELSSLISAFNEQHRRIQERHLDGQLQALDQDLTNEVSAISAGRSIHLTALDAEPALADLLSALEGKLSGDLDVQVLVPHPARTRRGRALTARRTERIYVAAVVGLRPD